MLFCHCGAAIVVILCHLLLSFFAMAHWLWRWIPNPGVPCSKPLGGSKVNSAFHPSKVNKMSTRNYWELVVKSRLPPRSGSSLGAVEPHP